MFGCCGFSRKKFKNQDGKVDQERAGKVKDEARQAGYTEDQAEDVIKCRCLCHTDGIVCMR